MRLRLWKTASPHLGVEGGAQRLHGVEDERAADRIGRLRGTHHLGGCLESRAPRRRESTAIFFVPGNARSCLPASRFESEKRYAFELGYKPNRSPNLTASVATFYNIMMTCAVWRAAAVHDRDGLEGESYGVELEVTRQILSWWRLNAGYTFLDLQLHTKPGSTDTTQEGPGG